MVFVQKECYKYLDEINEAVLRQIPINKTARGNLVLDVGCGTGALSEAIQNKGYKVWGIELNKEAAEIATKRITKVINLDLRDTALIRAEIKDMLFDYLVFADILEHLYDPLRVLKEYLAFLKTGGFVLVSLPNTVAWINRIMFLLGRFEYTETGIMDNDHIRFFTFKTAKILVKSAGCSVVKVDYIPYFVRVFHPAIRRFLLKNKNLDNINRGLLLDSAIYKWYTRYINPIEYFLGYFFKSLFAFKMVIIGKKYSNGAV